MYRALFVASAVALLAACGSGSTPTPISGIDFDAAARDAAESALMTLEDLPQFWLLGDPDDTNLDIDLTPECDVFDTSVSAPGAAATDAAPPYEGTEAKMATFVTAAFREEGTAIDALDGLDPLVDRCRSEFLVAIEEAARSEAEDRGFALGPFGRVEVALDDYDFVSVGDQSQALRIFVEVRVLGIGPDFTLDLIVVRVGRMIGTMTYSNFEELDAVEEEEIARTMTDKLTEAEAALPGVGGS